MIVHHVAVVYLACFFFGLFPNIWVMAVTFPAFLMVPGATYLAWGKARDMCRKELEQTQVENSGKTSNNYLKSVKHYFGIETLLILAHNDKQHSRTLPLR